MFKKLKQKIEEEHNTSVTKTVATALSDAFNNSSDHKADLSTDNSPARSVTPTRYLRKGSTSSADGIISPLSQPSKTLSSLHRTESQESISSHVSVSSDKTPSGDSKEKELNYSKDELMHQLSRRADHIRRLEGKLADLAHNLKEQQLVNEGLDKTVEKQQERFHRRLEKREEEWKLKIETVDRERRKLEDRLKNVEAIKDRCLQRQDDIEELEGFQTQELAKVKHLLLNCQQELHSAEESLRSKCAEVDQLQEQLNKSMEELEGLHRQSTKDEVDKCSLQEQLTSTSSLLQELEESKELMEKQLAKLTTDQQESCSKNITLERSLHEMGEERDSLSYAHNTYVTHTETTLKEKEAHIEMLTDRVTTLEKRVNDCHLTGDDRFNAVLQEREVLEKKLSESMQQLSEIKCSWSDKITILEKQIANLNHKIAADSTEMNTLEQQRDEYKQQVDQQCKTLRDELTRCESQCQEYLKQLNESQTLATKQRKEYEEKLETEQRSRNQIVKEFQDKVADLEENFQRLKDDSARDQVRLKENLNKLESSHSVLLEKEIETEKHITEMEEENGRLKAQLSRLEKDLNSKCLLLSQAESDLETTKAKLLAAIAELEQNTTTNAQLQEKITAGIAELQPVKKELDEFMMRNAELSHQMELLRQEKNKNTNKLQDASDSLLRAQERITELEQQVVDVEESVAERIEGSERVGALKASVGELESEVVDKTKTIKLLQQRVSDMKKTLHKELKMQQPTAGDRLTSTGHFVNDYSERDMQVLVCNSDMLTGATNSHGPRTEDVNFKYLRHVVFKFMTGSGYEAQQLIRAVSVLLHFSPEEERLLKETLEWKTSWFGARPFKHRSNQQMNRAFGPS